MDLLVVEYLLGYFPNLDAFICFWVCLSILMMWNRLFLCIWCGLIDKFILVLTVSECNHFLLLLNINVYVTIHFLSQQQTLWSTLIDILHVFLVEYNLHYHDAISSKLVIIAWFWSVVLHSSWMMTKTLETIDTHLWVPVCFVFITYISIWYIPSLIHESI